ncbi:hypothetical protein F0U44_15015 [Nocardioides humilatus]|uniref:Collagen-like protein n=1 Tax=Nocardioides humilatus TaxID=2607660 RepID=A0A5B1LCD7_9ACTN|nr:hypothetical protein [Nocardioides humilatus]KAA1417944.1 hypothetical protein F0U44_15015 [Nocardioides humilatus]
MRVPKPSPSLAVAVAALVVSLGGTSYAVAQIGSADIVDDSVRSIDVTDGTLRSRDIRDGGVRLADLSDGARQAGPVGPQGPQGPAGPAGAGRWLLINAAGEIEAQSGGFTIAAAYPTLPNTLPLPENNSLRASGNVYINAGEDLSNNGLVAVIALQNQLDQNADGVTNGRSPNPDSNPEFSGEISTTVCGVANVVVCAPPGTNETTHFVVSPRNSDGTVTMPGARKRFYVIVSGDSTN